jgi:hypothetical protein
MVVVRWRQECSVDNKSSALIRGSGRVTFSLIKLSGETEDEFGQDLVFHRLSVFDLSGFKGGAGCFKGKDNVNTIVCCDEVQLMFECSIYTQQRRRCEVAALLSN